ncbi:hypothetical protein LUZ60_011265 [Juncus effusus]|nr:hypothetical protein LUZ60_011265 [Juncus effusus]
MEARIGAERPHFYAAGGDLELNLGKRGIEWDSNHWNWNPDLFLANPGNQIHIPNRLPIPSNSSSSCSEETLLAPTTQSEAEKRKRAAEFQNNEIGSLSLRIGNGGGEEREGKKGKVAVQTGRPVCQVEGCGADLMGCKDYHRRHKVCETHAKASTAVVGNSVQRFCQQCSRFHLLEEFDEGKRSCRRRLAGHNKRRRKAQSDAATSALGGVQGLDDKTTGCLIISLLKILGNLHSNNTEQSNNGQQDLGIHVLKNLANLASSIDIRSLSGLLQQNGSHSPETNAGPASDARQPVALKSAPVVNQEAAVLHVNGNGNGNLVSVGVNGNNNIPEGNGYGNTNKAKVRDFDLNDAFNETEETENENGTETVVNGTGSGTGSPSYPPWLARNPMQQNGSPPQQISGNSESLSAQSLSSSNGDGQCRTDRIVFKLFGKDPHDLPLDIRAQIFDWLNSTPTDVESYIKPGCVILTIYLRLPESKWTDLCEDLSYEMESLLNNCTDDFWQCGWIYATVQNEIVFIYNGRVVVNGSVPSNDYNNILSVKPIAVPHSTAIEFSVEGFNLANESTRIFCAFEGKQLFQEKTKSLIVERNGPNNEHLMLNFTCSIPNSRGRGFIEVEENGFSNNFIPFIVAEKEVCSEIRALEIENSTDTNPNNEESLKFLNELGWLLKKSQVISKYEIPKSEKPKPTFDLTRFIWLVNFAMSHDWCNVIKLFLDILFIGVVNLNGKSPKEVALSLDLLLNAIKRKCKGMVEILLRYSASGEGFIFRPDQSDESKSKLTPLHIAASISGMDDVIDALTNDPNMIGINAWKTVRDDVGQTPEDYARKLGHDSYLQLVQNKINQQQKSHVVIGIPESISGILKSGNSTFEISGKSVVPPPRQYCNSCTRQVARRGGASRTFLYRPALLSMVGIAAVCVCVGILLHTLPKVRYVVPSFRWELVDFGAI